MATRSPHSACTQVISLFIFSKLHSLHQLLDGDHVRVLGVHGLVHGDAGPPLHVLHLKLGKTGPAVIVIRLDDGQGGQGGVLQVAGEPGHGGGGRAGAWLL